MSETCPCGAVIHRGSRGHRGDPLCLPCERATLTAALDALLARVATSRKDPR